jgi:hypothetical protein
VRIRYAVSDRASRFTIYLFSQIATRSVTPNTPDPVQTQTSFLYLFWSVCTPRPETFLTSFPHSRNLLSNCHIWRSYIVFIFAFFLVSLFFIFFSPLSSKFLLLVSALWALQKGKHESLGSVISYFYGYIENYFPFMYSQNRASQVSLLISS